MKRGEVNSVLKASLRGELFNIAACRQELISLIIYTTIGHLTPGAPFFSINYFCYIQLFHASSFSVVHREEGCLVFLSVITLYSLV